MKLSRLERLLLANQYLILEKVDPDPEEAKYYRRYREALQAGYELEYGDIAHLIDEHTLTEDACRFVMAVLDMHRVLHYSYRDLKDKSGIDPHQIQFRGFDGNNEAAQLGYMRYLRAQDKWQELGDPGDDFNSHMPTLGRYSQMLQRWKQSKDEEQSDEGRHPSHHWLGTRRSASRCATIASRISSRTSASVSPTAAQPGRSG